MRSHARKAPSRVELALEETRNAESCMEEVLAEIDAVSTLHKPTAEASAAEPAAIGTLTVFSTEQPHNVSHRTN